MDRKTYVNRLQELRDGILPSGEEKNENEEIHDVDVCHSIFRYLWEKGTYEGNTGDSNLRNLVSENLPGLGDYSERRQRLYPRNIKNDSIRDENDLVYTNDAEAFALHVYKPILLDELGMETERSPEAARQELDRWTRYIDNEHGSTEPSLVSVAVETADTLKDFYNAITEAVEREEFDVDNVDAVGNIAVGGTPYALLADEVFPDAEFVMLEPPDDDVLRETEDLLSYTQSDIPDSDGLWSKPTVLAVDHNYATGATCEAVLGDLERNGSVAYMGDRFLNVYEVQEGGNGDPHSVETSIEEVFKQFESATGFDWNTGDEKGTDSSDEEKILEATNSLDQNELNRSDKGQESIFDGDWEFASEN